LYILQSVTGLLSTLHLASHLTTLLCKIL